MARGSSPVLFKKYNQKYYELYLVIVFVSGLRKKALRNLRNEALSNG